MSETIEDMKNMFINEMGDVIVVDVSGCQLKHCKHIALRNVIRLQSKIHDRTDFKSVQVKLSDTEQRSFKIPLNTTGRELQMGILSDPLLKGFEKM